MKKLSPAQTVATCVALGKLRSGQRREWTVICDAIKGNCECKSHRISGSQIAVCLFWIAKSGNSLCVKDRLIEVAFKNLLQVSNDWTPLDIGWLLYFMRKKGERNELPIWKRMLSQIAYRFNERLPQMTPRNIACLLSEFGHMQILPGKTIHRALNLLDTQKDKIDAKTAVLLMGALADMRVFRSDIIHSLAAKFVDSGLVRNRMDMKQVASILYSYSKLDYAHKPLIHCCLARIRNSSTEQLSDVDLALLAYALGRLGIASCEIEWRIISEQLAERLDDISQLNLSVIVSGICKAGFKPEDDLLLKVARMVRKDASGFTERQLVNLVAALAIRGVDVGHIKVLTKISLNSLNRFQLNMLNPSKERVVMDIKIKTGVHYRLEDTLKLRGVVDINICPQIGALWADAAFKHQVTDYAVLILRDGDVCKLNPSRLLGPTSWKVRHMTALGYKVITVSIRDLRNLSNIPQLCFLGEEASVSAPRRPRKPFHYEMDTQKVSLR